MRKLIQRILMFIKGHKYHVVEHPVYGPVDIYVVRKNETPEYLKELEIKAFKEIGIPIPDSHK